MALLLGVDTGGTYTDAVLVKDDTEVIASAKSLTTKHDLSIGIGGAIAAVLQSSGVDPSRIAMASLSTTLATNALVEGQGGRVALIYVGFRESDLDSHGLVEALKGDPALVLQGGHSHAGTEAQPLDLPALDAFLEAHGDVSGFAVAAQFATRNPAHELAVMQRITEKTGQPVSASHQLSAKLNGPKRAMTAVLNARLIGMIDGLISSAQGTLKRQGIDAPLMVVRGDGALISSDLARARPIETILSGPAASLVGASWLTGAKEAIVSDIGGTTTDVALLKEGRPALDPLGAQVGPFRTMVEAVAMRTHGLGGDSEVHFVSEGLQGGVTLGPQRVVPISLLADEAPEIVHAALDAQLRSPVPDEHDGRFVRAVAGVQTDGLQDRDVRLLDRIAEDVQPLNKVLKTRIEMQSLKRLTARGIVQIGAVTPSDASHALGMVQAWDREAACKALLLLGRRRTGAGDVLAREAEAMARMIVERLNYQTGLALLETAFAEDDTDFGLPPETLARHVLTERGLSGHRGLLKLDLSLNRPVIGLGASAASYYPAVGAHLNCDTILPEHAGVANAIGAVVGRITIRKSGTITSPSEGLFRLHLDEGPRDFSQSAEAMQALERHLTDAARQAAREAGAEDIQISLSKEVRKAQIEAKEVFVEAHVTAEASGRPRITGESSPVTFSRAAVE